MSKILVLDDNEDILDILYLLLSESGYEVQALSGGERVFETIKEFHPDLVLMDVMLGTMDGRAICKNIKEDPTTGNISVILISAMPDLAQNLNQQGSPNDYVAKPFDIYNLLGKIEKQLAA